MANELSQLRDTRVLVTGGAGFLGAHIVARLQREGARVSVPRSGDYDLRDPRATERAFRDARPQVVVHAAADVGGIGYNELYAADVFTNNLRTAANVLEASSRAGVRKLVVMSSACAYPGEVTGTLREADLLAGPMHPTVEAYGISKRVLLIGARAYRRQYGLRTINLVLTNLYGPGDKFHPDESHVAAALVRKFYEAVRDGAPEVVCWGTGEPVREFLYAEDCAEAVALATVRYDGEEPLNVGNGVGTTIRELAGTVAKVAGFRGRVRWDTSRPNGAMRKVLDVTNIRRELGWEGRTTLEEGLRRTLAWYAEHTEEANATRRTHPQAAVTA